MYVCPPKVCKSLLGRFVDIGLEKLVGGLVTSSRREKSDNNSPRLHLNKVFIASSFFPFTHFTLPIIRANRTNLNLAVLVDGWNRQK